MLRPLIIFAGSLTACLALRNFAFSRFLKWSEKTDTKIDDVIIDSTKGPSLLWCIMLAVYATLHWSRLPSNYISISGKILLVLTIISITMVIANIIIDSIKVYSESSGTTAYVPSFTYIIIRLFAFIFAVIIILNGLGVSIAPILATLGVGGIAIALALQDTLSNLFAGFYILISRQIKVNDFIKLENGDEGYVADMNWRTTKVRLLSNNIVLIPNDRLTKSVITNYNLPDARMNFSLTIGIDYKSDLDKVEKAVLETAKDILKNTKGGVADFEPIVRFSEFADSSIQFFVVLQARELADRAFLKHEFIKKLTKRFEADKINIPYPISTVLLKNNQNS